MTDSTQSRMDEIEARKNAATKGPWRWDEKFGEDGDTGLALTNAEGAEIVGAYNHHCCSFRDDPTVEESDAVFIAHAPQDITDLLDLARKQQAALDAVRAKIGVLMDGLAEREERWKASWQRGELSHEEAVSATFEDRWAYAELAAIRAALTGEGGA